MELTFEKWHGTGNDFVMVFDPGGRWQPDEQLIREICERRTGVGADGLIIVREDVTEDFRMIYFNSDGRESSMCGNGGRCVIAFAAKHGLGSDSVRFRAIDGVHEGRAEADGRISLRMMDVRHYTRHGEDFVLDTGSPHYVRFTSLDAHPDFEKEAAAIRHHPDFAKQGINVNFVEEPGPGLLAMRTYERGVEAETLSCGTGAVAAALAAARRHEKTGMQRFEINTRGGRLIVKFRADADAFRDIWLTGPARYVFSGSLPV